MKAFLKKQANSNIIWAHMGLGRTVRPSTHYWEQMEEILRDPAFRHVYFDISWTEAAKYLVANAETTKMVADLIERYPDRFLFGTDSAAPKDQSEYLKVYYQYDPLWKLLSEQTLRKIRLANYERIFDEARIKVRSWERTHVQ
jgi:predicted TIM-barrel fold metal-dependent hydrolase